MNPKLLVNLGNFILSISDAVDLAMDSLAMHQQRVAFIVWEMAKKANLDEKRIEDVFLAGLLHDIGALSVEEKKSLHDNESSDINTHCIRGHNLFKLCPWLENSAGLVQYHHRDWDAWNMPLDTPLVFDSQLICIADHVERQIDRGVYILHQHEKLRSHVKKMAGRQVASELVDLFLEISEREEFWLDLSSPRLYSLLLHYGPFKHVEIGIETILVFSRLLAMIVDFKSHFTATHSSGVAQCAMIISELTGMSALEISMMEAAGLLHDVGKLVVPNAILEKPAALTTEEMAVIKQHPYHTFTILNSIGGLKMVAEWAAFHHERLDGEGYPFHREASEISLGSRILAVSDVFTALAEDRPYRKGMDTSKTQRILTEMASQNHLDPQIVKLLIENIGEVRNRVSERQAQAHRFFHQGIENSEIIQ